MQKWNTEKSVIYGHCFGRPPYLVRPLYEVLTFNKIP